MVIDIWGKRLLLGMFKRPRQGLHSKLSPFSETTTNSSIASKGKNAY